MLEELKITEAQFGACAEAISNYRLAIGLPPLSDSSLVIHTYTWLLRLKNVVIVNMEPIIMECQECKFKYPVKLLTWMVDSSNLKGLVCGVCALNLDRERYGPRDKFVGEEMEGKRQAAILHRHENATHYVVCNSGNALFVKEAKFFEDSGGVTEDWGQTWVPVIAESIGKARIRAGEIFGVEVSPIHAEENG